MQLYSKEERQETAVKAGKSPFMTAVAIKLFYKSFFLHTSPVKLEVKFYDSFIETELSTGHVQVKKNPVHLKKN